MITASDKTIILCWILFVVYWIVSARRLKPTAEKQSRLSNFAHRGPLGLGYILLCCRALPWPLNLELTPQTEPARASGAVLCVLGLLVAIWSRRVLAGNWSSDVTFKQGHELIQTGPYRYARHPIYTGLLLMCLGTAMAGGELRCWLGFLIACAGLWIKLTQEESLMLRHFPDAYPPYRARVKAIIPFIL
ncbi:MAG: isoprenylcysteine carboxylmethyltransferase family protein [Verrucomicrobiota bacterium]|jgi:protein-S-isoprenylcysteine O-methyltransferase Ste14